MTHINPLEVFGDDLLSVQNPSRYLGGEYGQIIKDDSISFTFAMAFPDLYEIGMSNQAIKILYNGLNARKNIRCERVFTPDEEFERLLKEKNTPLYTLETGIPLVETDVIGVSIGYELGITGLLSILDNGKIPLCNNERSENDPIIIAGGCGVTNPVPFAKFIDAFFIGEAENAFFDLFEEIADLKNKGATRSDLLEKITSHPNVWVPGKKAKRAIQNDFGKVPSIVSYLPVPNIRPVQDHGVEEIMRGCPNGCRFCHAGVYYRPQRIKSPEIILNEIDDIIYKGGNRQVSLSSLSSGDYPEIENLLNVLTKKYESARVSFQLPSLKVNSFTLPLLEKLSEVRKSGLTFAVETPSDAWQLSLNKEVFKERLIEIILEAKKRGWSKAKFYFMIGLPPGNDDEHIEFSQKQNYIHNQNSTTCQDSINNDDSTINKKKEEQEIVDFLLEIQEKTRIACSVNVGTFIPKSHTPYERVRQLSKEESREKMYFIRSSLPRGKFKVSTHNEYVSYIEGMISRGDEKVSDILLAAYKKGCRLDAWEDHMQRDLWDEAIAESGIDIEKEYFRKREDNEILPWSEINLGPVPNFYITEFKKSVDKKLTPKCEENCKTPCGVCNVQKSIHVNTVSKEEIVSLPKELLINKHPVVIGNEFNIPVLYRVVFSFSKLNGGEFIPHLATQEVFHKAFLRSELPIMYTDGFNPTPRLELATTLSLGIESYEEIGACILRTEEDPNIFIKKMNNSLPDTLRIINCMIFPISNKKKRESLSTVLYGSKYKYSFRISDKDFNEFLNSDLLKNYLTENKDIIIEKTQVQNNSNEKTTETVNSQKFDSCNCSFEITLPFNNDRPFRNLICDYFQKQIYQVVHITKLSTYGIFNNKIDNYFDTFKNIADIHSKLI